MEVKKARKNLIVIAGIFYPIPSPPGRCAKQYIDLLKEDFDITVVFIQSGLDRTNGKNEDGYTLFSLFNWRIFLLNYFSGKVDQTNKTILKVLISWLTLSMRAFGRIQAYFYWPDNLLWFYGKAYRKLDDLNKENPIDYILTVNSPFTAHLAGRKFIRKNPNVSWITFTFDPFIHTSESKKSYIFPNLKRKWDFEAEKSVFAEADFNYIIEAAYTNCSELYKNSSHKTLPMPFLIEKITGEAPDYFDKSKMNMVFAGRFYYDIRNPEYLLKTFIFLNDENTILHLFVTSNCAELITNYINLSKARIILHNPVSVDQIQKIMNSADFLINVGNSLTEFKPSKIAEYISTGKPVINFYQNNIIDEILLDYPLSLQIDTNRTEISEAALKIKQFCKTNYRKQIPWENIRNIYPQYSAVFAKELLSKGFQNPEV